MRQSSLLKLLLLFSLLFNLTVFVLAQEKTSAEIIKTTKLDQFGDISEKEFAPKLKNYFEVLKKDRNLKGVVIFYNSFNNNLFRQTSYFEKRKLESYFEYLNGRCDPLRITFVQGGFREKMMTELWLVPPAGELPEPKSSEYQPPENLNYQLELLGTEELDFAEAEIKRDEDRDEEAIVRKTNDFQEVLYEVLRKDTSWRSVLIYYADEADFDVKIIHEKIAELLKTKKIDLNRVQIKYGGYRRYPQIESWIVPKNGIEPEAMPFEKILEN
jgi:hypothetical protein